MMRDFLLLLDDGSLDTVFLCSYCNEQIRYSDFPRDEYGYPDEDAWEDADNEHLEECIEWDKIRMVVAEGQD
jgi:hypothetical protein